MLAPVLTKRTLEVLKYASLGYQAKEIARFLGVSHRTVEQHRVLAVNILGARNVSHAVAIGIVTGILSSEDIIASIESRRAA